MMSVLPQGLLVLLQALLVLMPSALPVLVPLVHPRSLVSVQLVLQVPEWLVAPEKTVAAPESGVDGSLSKPDQECKKVTKITRIFKKMFPSRLFVGKKLDLFDVYCSKTLTSPKIPSVFFVGL